MAVSAADLIVSFSTRGVDAVTGALSEVDGRLGRFQQSTLSAGKALTGFLTVPIVGAFTGTFMAAAGLEQAVGKTEAVFGSSANAMLAWADTSAQSFGMSRTQALSMASTYSQILQAQGMASDQSVAYSQNLIGLAADMSAFTDVSTDRTTLALQSALTGEYESLKQFGIVLKADTVEQEAMNLAIAAGRSEVTEADRQLARYNLIMEQTTQMHGQFAREATGASGSLAIARAEFMNAAAAMGQHLLPVGTQLIQWATGLITAFSSLSPSMMKWVVIAMAAAAAIGPILIGIGMMIPALSALAAGFLFLISPVGLIVLGVAALAAGLVLLYTRSERFRNVVNKIGSTLKTAGKAVFDFVRGFSLFSDALNDIEGLIGDTGRAITGWFDSMAEKAGFLGGTVSRMGSLLRDALTALTMPLVGIARLFSGDLTGAIEAFKTAGLAAFRALITGVTMIPRLIWDGFQAIPWGRMFDGLMSAGLAAFGSLLTWIGGLGQSISGAISGAWGWLQGVGADFIGGLLAGAQNAWGAVTTWVQTNVSGSTITGWIGSAWGWLLGTGWDIIDGLWTGAKNIWDSVVTWAQGKLSATTFSGFAIDALSWLEQTGKDVIQGLWDGAKGVWALVENWFNEKLGWIEGVFDSIAERVSSVKALLGLGGDSGAQVSSWGDVGTEVGASVQGPRFDAALLAAYNRELEALALKMQAATVATDVMTVAGDSFGLAGRRAFRPWYTGFMDMTPQQVAAAGAMYVMEQAGMALGDGMSSMGAKVGAAITTFATSINPLPTITQQSFGTSSAIALTSMSGMNTGVTNNANTMRSNVSAAMAGTQMAVALQSMLMMAAAKAQGLVMVSNATSASSAMRAAWTAGAQGSAAAIANGMGIAVAAVRSGASSMVAAVRAAAGQMHGAGADAIAGLVGGVRSGLGALQAVVNEAISIMAQIPAQGRSPWPMMIGAGEDAMDGLVIGVDRRLPALGKTIDRAIGLFDVGPYLGASGSGLDPFAGAYAATPQPTANTRSGNNYYITVATLPTDEWLQVAKGARDGEEAKQIWDDLGIDHEIETGINP